MGNHTSHPAIGPESRSQQRERKNFEAFREMSSRFLEEHLKELAPESTELLTEGISHVIYHTPGRLLISPMTNMKINVNNPRLVSQYTRDFLETTALYNYRGAKALRDCLEEHYFLAAADSHGFNSAILLENLTDFNYKRLKKDPRGSRLTPLDFAIRENGFIKISEGLTCRETQTYRTLFFDDLQESPIN